MLQSNDDKEGAGVASETPAALRAEPVRSRAPGRSDGDASPAGERGYEPPSSPDEDSAFWLGLKVALAASIANFIAIRSGFDAPTWSVLTASFLATNPPIASGRAALRKMVALAVGIALGLAGAFMASAMSGLPMLHIALVGLVAGALGSRSPDYLFAAVVGTVVTFVGSGGGNPPVEVAARTVVMVLIGCAVGPAVVWTVEKLRARLHERRHA